MTAARRLNALETAFLDMDARGTPFAVGAVLRFDRAPLATASGDLDTERVRQHYTSLTDRQPHYRQLIRRVPLLGHPVWVDADPFELDHHVTFTRLPAPGSEADLQALVSRIFSSVLPLDRPPWHIVFVDGLAGNRFAVISRFHHSLVDGVAGARLLEHSLRGIPDASIPPHTPCPVDRASRARLLVGELAHRARGMAGLRRSLPGRARQLVPALGDLLARGLRPASDAGLNRKQVGPDRLIAGWQVSMADVKKVRRHFDATVNDVVLAIATGALHRFLARRGADVAHLTDFRAMVPASTHAATDSAMSGNHVALLLTQLPVDEADPARRIERVRATTRALKGISNQVAAGEFLARVADVTAPSLLSSVLRLTLARRAYNIVITNIPGPPFPLYMLGCRLESFQPIVNLWPGHMLGLAWFSYAGTMHCGINADREVIPELDGLLADFDASFAELRELALAAEPAAAEVAAAEVAAAAGAPA